ncbi:MAG TPA: hypothetical protein VGL28_02735 [Steroidobacteraceae bacterium]
MSDVGTTLIAGAPFVPTPGPDNGEGGVQTEPDLLALSPGGSYLYALYNENYNTGTLYSFHMVNGVPEQVAMISGAGTAAYSEYGGQARTLAASADHVFVATGPDDNSNGQGRLYVFNSAAGALSAVGEYIMTSVNYPLSVQIDPAEHFVYIGYANPYQPSNNPVTGVEVPPPPNFAAVYDINSFPPTLIDGAQPQSDGLQIGAN